MTTDVSQHLQDAINALLAQNKQPTVALIKSKLSMSVPIPQIISALQHVKAHGNHSALAPIHTPANREAQLEARIDSLEKEISALQERVARLEQR